MVSTSFIARAWSKKKSSKQGRFFLLGVKKGEGGEGGGESDSYLSNSFDN